MQHGSSRPSFTKFAVYGEYKRPCLQEEVISFISPSDIVGKKWQAVGHTTPFSSPKQKPCKAVTETQLLHHSGIDVCCSSAASLSCLPSHSSTAHQHSGFPLPCHEYLRLQQPTHCLLHRNRHWGLEKFLGCPFKVPISLSGSSDGIAPLRQR